MQLDQQNTAVFTQMDPSILRPFAFSKSDVIGKIKMGLGPSTWYW
jgi:hypothetical protein